MNSCNGKEHGFISVSHVIKELFDVSREEEFDGRCLHFMFFVGQQKKEWDVPCCVNKDGELMVHKESFVDWANNTPSKWGFTKNESFVDDNGESLIKEGQALLRKIVSRYEPIYFAEDKHRLRKIVEPKKKDDWYYVLYEAIRVFEQQHGHTPNESQLWLSLNRCSLKGYEFERAERLGVDGYQLFGGKHLDREAFKKRYQRLYSSEDDV